MIETNLLKQKQRRIKDAVKDVNNFQKLGEKLKGEEPKESRSNRMIKSLVLSALSIASSFLAWYMLSTLLGISFLGNGKWAEFFYRDVLSSLILTFLAFFLMVVFIAVSSFLIKPRWVNIINIAISVSIYFLFFKPEIYTVLVVIVLFLVFMGYDLRIDRESKMQIHFSVIKNIRFGMGWVVTFLLIVISLTVFQFMTMENRSMKQFNDSMIGYTAEVLHGVFAAKLEGYESKMTLDEFLVLFATDEIVDDLAEGDEGSDTVSLPTILEKLLSEDQRNTLLRIVGEQPVEDLVKKETKNIETEVSNEIRREFLEGLGIEAQGTESMQIVVQRFVQQKYDEYLAPYREFIPSVLVFGLYFVLQIFSFIYIIIIKLLASLIFYILKLVGFVKIKEVEVMAKRAEL